jgi:hypothetical protein
MLDTARAAEMADPDRNALFSRRWRRPPHSTRKGPGRDTRASFAKPNLKFDELSSTPAKAAQRAIVAAAKRAEEDLYRRSHPLAALGLTNASLRTAAIADTIRAMQT